MPNNNLSHKTKMFLPISSLRWSSLRWGTLVGLILSICFGATVQADQEETWTIPMAGNVYRSQPNPFHGNLRRNGTLRWNDSKDVFSVYFHVDRSCQLMLKLNIRAMNEAVNLLVKIDGQEFPLTIANNDFSPVDVGQVVIGKAGYVRVDLQIQQQTASSTSSSTVEMESMFVSSETAELNLTSVATNQGNMFYWGRRGPSVHLTYDVPREVEIQYGYSEIRVAEGDDPIGSYFMANGFAEGYFGIQVNSDRERRVLFSVWSPFQTDDPRAIPEDQRIELLARGTDVNTGEFGNEGSGGQSYLIYPWQAGRTYRFLTEVKPDGQGNTIYTSWFGDKEANEWRLIASFRRPQTDTYLRRFHSFLENFNPQTGHLMRQAEHRNVWVRDTQANWHECLNARFSVDATGGGGHRLDFAGGAKKDYFFMRNCGFFEETVAPGARFTRQSAQPEAPEIKWGQLPRE